MAIQTDLVVMLQQLYDDADIGRYVLDGCCSHDVGSILLILVGRSPIGNDQHDVSLMDLQRNVKPPSINSNQ